MRGCWQQKRRLDVEDLLRQYMARHYHPQEFIDQQVALVTALWNAGTRSATEVLTLGNWRSFCKNPTWRADTPPHKWGSHRERFDGILSAAADFHVEKQQQQQQQQRQQQQARACSRALPYFALPIHA